MANCCFTYIYIFDNGGRLKTKLNDKRVDFSFLKVNFPSISSNIPVSPTYGMFHNSYVILLIVQIIVILWTATDAKST